MKEEEIARKIIEETGIDENRKFVVIEVPSPDWIAFHPNGCCGSIETGDDYFYGLKCETLLWAKGYCDTIEENRKTKTILVYGNYQGVLQFRMIVFPEE